MAAYTRSNAGANSSWVTTWSPFRSTPGKSSRLKVRWAEISRPCTTNCDSLRAKTWASTGGGAMHARTSPTQVLTERIAYVGSMVRVGLWRAEGLQTGSMLAFMVSNQAILAAAARMPG